MTFLLKAFIAAVYAFFVNLDTLMIYDERRWYQITDDTSHFNRDFKTNL